MRVVLLILAAICLVLWCERYYWRRTAELLESRLRGEDRATSVRSLLDAWIDGKIETRLRKR